VAIDDFGKSMLSNMGWKEGEVVGRNQKNTIVEPIEYIPR
jgi:hypothetical protein